MRRNAYNTQKLSKPECREGSRGKQIQSQGQRDWINSGVKGKWESILQKSSMHGSEGNGQLFRVGQEDNLDELLEQRLQWMLCVCQSVHSIFQIMCWCVYTQSLSVCSGHSISCSQDIHFRIGPIFSPSRTQLGRPPDMTVQHHRSFISGMLSAPTYL